MGGIRKRKGELTTARRLTSSPFSFSQGDRYRRNVKEQVTASIQNPGSSKRESLDLQIRGSHLDVIDVIQSHSDIQANGRRDKRHDVKAARAENIIKENLRHRLVGNALLL
jgi:hypothetical protein